MTTPAFADTVDLTGTVRDFHASHPDFEAEIGGLQTGQVSSTLGGDKNPVFVEPSKPGFHGTANFNQWYNDVAVINSPDSLTITLDNTITPDPNVFTFTSSSFFPIDGMLFGNEGNPHNYHFTYEIHSDFTYLGGEMFAFTGDDDLWVFINDNLEVDLGGVHGMVSGGVDLDTLGLTVRHGDYQVVYRSVPDYRRVFGECGLIVRHLERNEAYMLVQFGCETVQMWKDRVPGRFQLLRGVGHTTYFLLRLGNLYLICDTSGYVSS